MEQQLKAQFHKAFYDVVRDSVERGNHEHIVRLYAEIGDRIAAKVNPTGDTHRRIREDFDVALFRQMLEHDAFDGQSLLRLVNTTFTWIRNLQMPVRDPDTAAAKQRVMASGRTMVDVVPAYIREVHGCLDTLDADLKEFYDNRNHPVVQHMLRRGAHKK